MKFIILVIFATVIKCTYSEFFSSTDELRHLTINYKKFVDLLKDLSSELDKKSLYIQKILRKVEDEHALITQNVDTYIGNPLNAFSMIKTMTYDVNAVQDSLKNIDQFSKKADKIKLPSSELFGAVEGLYRLQFTYDLKTEHFAKGIIHNKRYRRELPTSDLIILAKEMMKLNEDYALEYIKVAKELSLKSDKKSRMSFLEELFDFYNTTSKYNEAVEILDEILEIDPTFPKYEEQRMNIELLSLFSDKKEKAKKPDNSHQLYGSHFTAKKESLIYNKACRDKLKKPIGEVSKLHCKYVSNTFFTKIAPFKVMEANLDPFVGIYLDVISDKEIELLQKIARKNLNRAQVLNVNSSRISRGRVAQLSWPSDSQHKIFQILTNRVKDMTGLNMETSEKWQIQNYGIGGYYAAHHDFSSKGQEFQGNSGNRIATTLFYLSDVEKGGGTVFPLLRIYVPPKKGTAAFWYNLSTSGNREYMTQHAACPVLVGSKWVANKWIREYGQESARPCELTPKSIEENYHLKMYDLKDYGIEI